MRASGERIHNKTGKHEDSSMVGYTNENATTQMEEPVGITTRENDILTDTISAQRPTPITNENTPNVTATATKDNRVPKLDLTTGLDSENPSYFNP